MVKKDDCNMNGAKRSAEAVECQNASVGESSTLEGSKRESRGSMKQKRECRLE